MDRFEKLVETLRLKWQIFFNHNWHNDPPGDYFRSLDHLIVLGTVRFEHSTKWKRRIWNVLCVLLLYSYSFTVLNFVEQTFKKFDLVDLTWYSIQFLATTLCFLKDFILRQNYESIQTVRGFMNRKSNESGNESKVRMRLFRKVQLVVLVFHMTWLLDEVVIQIPSSGIEQLIGIPRIMRYVFGSNIAEGLGTVNLLVVCPLWLSKYFAGTGMICFLLAGLKNELEIYTRGFGNILDRVQLDVEENLPLFVAPHLKQAQRKKLFWKYLNQNVTNHVKKHIELLEHMQLLQPIVQNLFGIIYYNAIVLISPLIYVIYQSGISGTTFFLVSTGVGFFAECFWWCKVVDSFQDINETLEVEIFNLIAKIRHTEEHHKDFVDMRTTLLIMKTNVRNNAQFSCGGVFPVSVEVFRTLLDVSYSVLTFLIDFGKSV